MLMDAMLVLLDSPEQDVCYEEYLLTLLGAARLGHCEREYLHSKGCIRRLAEFFVSRKGQNATHTEFLAALELISLMFRSCISSSQHRYLSSISGDASLRTSVSLGKSSVVPEAQLKSNLQLLLGKNEVLALMIRDNPRAIAGVLMHAVWEEDKMSAW